MQDSEFDKLFKDKFEDAEVQPSANLWNSIEKELEPRRRNLLPAYWMAAAVVLIALAVGLLMPETEKIRLHGSDMASIDPPVPNNEVTASVEQQPATMAHRHESTPLVIAPRLTDADVEKDFAAVQPKATEVHLVNEKPEMTNAVVSQIVNEPVKPETDMVIARADVTDESNAITETEPTERKGFRNVGDLVNYVVDKVDKRDRKFIRFNTDEDDNSSLVAINIGILKFNKRSDK